MSCNDVRVISLRFCRFGRLLYNFKGLHLSLSLLLSISNCDEDITRKTIRDKYWVEYIILRERLISFDKDYSEKGQNGVFVLHPSNDAVPVAINPQSWAQHSFLGEITMFDWDDTMREQQYHKYGAIKLSPIDTVSYLDELQRLVGMCLQYGVENNKLNKQHPITLTDSTEFCIQCGGTDLNYSQGNNDKVWWATCNDCKHFTIYSYCSNSECRTRLVKNGDYWNYHSIEALEPINVQCPACSEHF